jgi:ferredoxin-NADP reductase
MSAPSVFSNLQYQFNKMLFNTSAQNYFEPIVEKYFPKHSLVNNKATIVNIHHEKNGMITITVQPNKKWNGFIPGQFVEIGVQINAVNYFRNFSISSSLNKYKNENLISFTIQKQFNGKVTNWIFESLKIGDRLTISEAKGDFVNSNSSSKVLYIAGGSGITPFKSMIEECVVNNVAVTLLYYAKSQQHIFESEFMELEKNKNVTIHFFNSTSDGRINIYQIQKYCPDFSQRNVFICGPNTMIEDAKQLLIENNAIENNIISEYFKAVEFKPNVDLNHNKSNLKLNNKSIETVGNTTILEQMEANGLHPKYGCRMGLCKQCSCTKTKGIVFNKLTNTYSEATTETIQICVSIPIGEVEINL